jgi:ABC-2 type transport system ATP-binding protein
VTVVLTTHYMDEVERLADQVHVVDHGRLVASGLASGACRAGLREHDSLLRPATGSTWTGLTGVLPPGSRCEEIAPGSYVVHGK